MTSRFGILSYGAYIPRRRLQRAAVFAANGWFAGGLKGLAWGERAIGDWDEDSVTMAVEAGRDALSGIDRATVGSISLASTTLPFIDRSNAGIVKEALTVPDESGAMDVTGSQRAATSGLIQALAAARGGARPHLAIAADMRKARPASEAELVNGDGSAALLIGEGEPIATLLGHFSTTIDFVDHYRSSGMQFDYVWESRWIREEGYTGLIGSAIRSALESFGIDGAAIDRFILPINAKGVAEGLAKRASIKPEAVADRLAENVGECGVAHPFLLLANAFDVAEPGEKILLVGFGQGVDVLLFEVTDALKALPPRRGVKGNLSRRIPDSNYMRWLFHRGLVDLDRGMRAEFDQKQPGTTLWRHRKAVLGLVGGRCSKTGTVQFPKTDISVNANDHAAHTQEDYPLAERRARIVTFTADSLTYSPNPPNYYGLIDFDGGGRLTVEFADVTAEDVDVGAEMEMVFRIKAFDEARDFVRYFWKAAPVATREKQ
jgi:3-hydroxy-3-methylglutaryl CoA synthase